MKSTATIRMENYGELIQAGISNSRALQLQSISRSLHRLDEHSCNYGLTERQEKGVESLEKKAQLIATEHGFTAYHQGDPRGWSLYVISQKELDRAKEQGYSIDSIYDRGIAVCPH